jgi:preprotein translocase subunit SecB
MIDHKGTETGFVLEKVAFPKQSYAAVPVGEGLPKDQPMKWGWDWRWLAHDRFEVAVTLRVEPSSTRPETVEVTALGVFRLQGQAQTVDLKSFAYGNAPAILFPYVRQAIYDLTGRGLSGPQLLRPMNVAVLMKMVPEDKAQGVAQKRPPA